MKSIIRAILDTVPIQWIFRILKSRIRRYPAKLQNKTRADFIEKIKKHNEKESK